MEEYVSYLVSLYSFSFLFFLPPLYSSTHLVHPGDVQSEERDQQMPAREQCREFEAQNAHEVLVDQDLVFETTKDTRTTVFGCCFCCYCYGRHRVFVSKHLSLSLSTNTSIDPQPSHHMTGARRLRNATQSSAAYSRFLQSSRRRRLRGPGPHSSAAVPPSEAGES